jgi:hypothetical protein
VLLFVGAWYLRQEMQPREPPELQVLLFVDPQPPKLHVLLFMDPQSMWQKEEGGWARNINIGDKENKEEMGARLLWQDSTRSRGAIDIRDKEEEEERGDEL